MPDWRRDCSGIDPSTIKHLLALPRNLSLIRTMMDHASVNNVAIHGMKINLLEFTGYWMFSYSLDLVGDDFKFPNMTKFVSTYMVYTIFT